MIFTKSVAVLGAILALGALVGCGAPAASPGSAAVAGGPREIKIEMSEFSFTPDRIQVKPGERVHFVLVNRGTVQHEIVFGDEEGQEEHEAEMASGMATEMHEAGEATVDPGQTKTMEYTFPDQPGTLFYGCHIPGHWPAGMKGTVTIK